MRALDRFRHLHCLLAIVVGMSAIADDDGLEPTQDVVTEPAVELESPAPVASNRTESRRSPRVGDPAAGYVPEEVPRGADAFQRLLQRSVEIPVDAAIDQTAAFIDRNPDHLAARLFLARLYVRAGYPHEALREAASLKSVPQADWRPWFYSATANILLGYLDDARDDLDEALVRDGSVPEVWVQLAVLEQERGNHAAALQYLSIAGELDPNLGQIHLNRAYSLERMEDYPAALLAYQDYLTAQVPRDEASIRPRVIRRVAYIAQVLSSGEEFSADAPVGRHSNAVTP